ncbi:fibronectin type III domain-containing protein [Hydrogenoanaerobacterium saccharovorans]|uniref:Fibronectin type III domain-containing protein n=1 Tax=Hydrogenoanaerobacterium saccharovorans TaxID=474960 RepID=A0ABS2GNX3_9FIRM|nr:fibronectin type III domain-containing protein [Hydrogenoanaerobacterium saccharovorans]
MGTPISQLAEGTTLKIKKPSGTIAIYYIAKHNYEPNLNGNGRCAVVLKEHEGSPGGYNVASWDSNGENAYLSATIHTQYLKESFLNTFDEPTKKLIGKTKFYVSRGNQDKTIITGEAEIFLPSVTELGLTTRVGSDWSPAVEGSRFPNYSTIQVSGANSFWTRTSNEATPDKYNSASAYICQSGTSDVASTNTSAGGYIREMFTLPETAEVDDNDCLIVNEPPTTPSFISFETPKAGKNLGISWGESTDPDGDTIDYLLERQVDTGEWAQIAKTSATKYTDVCPSSGTNVNYRVKANDRKGGESDYRTGTAKAIVYNQPPSVPASITFGDPHAGKSLQITCAASTDPDGNPITYIWERQIDSGGWTQIGSGASTSITDTVPSSGTNINYRVKARDSEGAESGYRTGSAKAIIYNQLPTIPGVPQYKYPIPGEEMSVKWQASTDPESGAVTYIVETKLGDGEWTQARETPETSCLVSVPQVSAAGTMIIVRVKAKDQEGAESAYSTGETAEILYHKVIRKIPWQQGKPFKARQYTYNGKKQYQTMREGALAGIEAEP